MFNVQGSEMIFLLLIALVVLGPEKLPEAVRKFTKAYAEFKKMANGFQGEFRDVLEEPMRELRGTADALRDAAKFEFNLDATETKPAGDAPPATDAAASEPPREPGLNFGSANPRRHAAAADAVSAPAEPIVSPREPGLNFGSANARRQTRIARADAGDGTGAAATEDTTE